MKKFVAMVAAGALAMSAFAGVASASGNAYGKTIKESCSAPFGQLVVAAFDAEHITNAKGGAKAFAGTIYPAGPHCAPSNNG
jgi:hypothetical protein